MMMNVNAITPAIQNQSPEKTTFRSTSHQSPSPSPKKTLKVPAQKPKQQVEIESPLQKNKHSNTMRQVHVSLKPKQTVLEADPATNFMKRKERSNMDVPEYEKPLSRQSNASTGAASEEKFISTDAQITRCWNLKGPNRVNELIDFSEEVSSRIERTIDKIESIDQRATILLGSAKMSANSSRSK